LIVAAFETEVTAQMTSKMIQSSLVHFTAVLELQTQQ